MLIFICIPLDSSSSAIELKYSSRSSNSDWLSFTSGIATSRLFFISFTLLLPENNCDSSISHVWRSCKYHIKPLCKQCILYVQHIHAAGMNYETSLFGRALYDWWQVFLTSCSNTKINISVKETIIVKGLYNKTLISTSIYHFETVRFKYGQKF